jgi:hypothetical protein
LSFTQVVILNKALLGKKALRSAFEFIDEKDQKQHISWSSIAGRVIQTATGKLPSNVMLAIHARNALRYAVRKGWCAHGDVVIPQPPQADHKILEDFLVSQSVSPNSSKSGEEDQSPQEDVEGDEQDDAQSV